MNVRLKQRLAQASLCALAVVPAIPAVAQDVTANEVRITIHSGCKTFPYTAVDLVRRGDENVMRRTEGKNSEWVDSGAKVDPRADTFSLRLGTARTDCRRARAIRDHDADIARLEFKCSNEKVQDVTIEVEPKMKLAWVRQMDKSGDDPDSVDCREYGWFEGYTGTILDVRSRDETLRLQLDGGPDQNNLGLRITVSELKKGADLNNDALLHLMRVNEVEGDGSGPSTAPVTDILRKQPSWASVKSLKIQVE